MAVFELISDVPHKGVKVAKLEFGAISEIVGNQPEKVQKIIIEMESRHKKRLVLLGP
jgi:hypothetical protein